MLKVLELFAGYGSQALSLEYLGIDFTSDIAEIDKYAIDAYNQIHGQTHNWGDVTKIDETKLPYYDLITYSSPCQDFSVAGLGKGGDQGSGTRSSLLWECERIIRAVKPKYLLMENVKNLVGKKHKHNFVKWLNTLEMMGYQNFWKVLNAKDYGVPKNRERVFVVSILGCGQYLFPNPIKLDKRLKDILEPVVDEKYYISDRMLSYIKNKEGKDYNFRVEISNPEQIRNTPIRASGDTACVQEPSVLTPKRTEYGRQIRKDYESGNVKESRHNMTELEPRNDGVSNTLTSVQKDNYVIEPLCVASRGRENGQELELNKTGCTNTLTSVQKDNYVLEPSVQQIGNIVHTGNWSDPQRGRIYSGEGISPALNCMQGGGLEPKILKNYRIRKLTPRECWRLMGVRDDDFDKIHGISNSQLYKMAGNSIVVDVLMAIFKSLLLDQDNFGQFNLFGGVA